MGEWARLNRWGNISGTVSGKARLRKGPAFDLRTLEADGFLKVDRFAWGVHKETAPISGRLSFKKGQLLIQDLSNLFRLNASFSPEKTVLSELELSLPSGMTLSANGTVEGPERTLSLQASVKRMPVRDLPMLLERYPEISGSIDFDGRLSGTAAAPVFTGTGDLNVLKLRRTSDPVDAHTDVHWTNEEFALSPWRVGSAWEGQLRWADRHGWDARLKAVDGDARFLGDLILLDAPLEGKINGDFHLNVSQKGVSNWEGTADVTWTRGKWGSLPFDKVRGAAKISGGVLSLKGFDVSQPSGSVHLEGALPLGKKTTVPSSFTAQFKHFVLPSLTLDGELHVSAGDTTVTGRPHGEFRSPNFWVNGIGLGSASGKFQWDGTDLRLAELRIGEDLRAEVSLNPGQRSLRGQLLVQEAEMSAWAPRWGMAHPLLRSGRVNAVLNWEGPWKAPRNTFRITWKNAAWTGAPFDISMKGSWDGQRVELEDIHAGPSGQPASLAGRGTVSFDAEKRSAPQIDLAVNLTGFPVHHLFGAQPDWKLPVDGRFTWRGPLTRPVLSGTFSGGENNFGNFMLRKWQGTVQWQNKELQFSDFTVETPDGFFRLKNGSRILMTQAGQGHFQMLGDMRNVHLGPLTFFGGMELAGQWKNSPVPRIDCNLRALSLWVNQHRFDQDLARLSWSGRELRFTPVPGTLQQLAGAVHFNQWPQLHFENLTLTELGQRRFWVQGEIGPQRWEFDVEGLGLDAETVIGLADMDFPVDGSLNVRVKGKGSPQAPEIEGDIIGEKGRFGRLPFDLATAHVYWNGSLLEISHLEAARKGRYLLKGGGRIPVSSDESETAKGMSFSVQIANGDMAVVQDLWPDCAVAKGSFHGELRLRPGVGGMQTSGHLVVENAEMKARKYFREITDLNARLLIRDNRLVFENLSARVGHGRLLIRGDLGLDGFDITDYNLTAESLGRPGISIEIPQLAVPPGPLLKRFSLLRESLENVSRGSPMVYLALTGPDGEQTLRGTIILEDTQFTYPPAKKVALKSGSWYYDFWNELNWDVLFKTADDTWYRNEFVNVQVKGNVRVFGPRKDIRAAGRIDTSRGVISYLGQSYQIKQGGFEVVTDTRAAVADRATVPYLWTEADRAAIILDRGVPTPDTITMIVDRAPLGELQPRFLSRNNPGWSSDQVAKKTLGLSEDQFTPLERDQLLRAGLVQLLGSTAGPLASRIAQRFGIDILYPIYEPEDSQLVQTPARATPVPRGDILNLLQGTGASAGMQLSNRVFGLYKFKMDQMQNQLFFRDEIELVYRIRGNLHLRASTELDTEKLLGQPPNRQAILENQWRFGQPKPPAPKDKNQPTPPSGQPTR